jgi:hypothetical protein
LSLKNGDILKVLLHTCCAPCLSGSIIPFEEEDIDVTAYWYNPNIQPFTEHRMRLQTLERFFFLKGIDHIIEDGYSQNYHILSVANELSRRGFDRKDDLMEDDMKNIRCRACYEMRASRTAELAKEKGYDAISSTLLLSKHQDHVSIKDTFKAISEENQIEFIYIDLRKYWKDSIRLSNEMELYRQNYCGCIFSEHERYRSK